MAEEEPAQHDSDEEWLAELLSLPRSSLPRPQTATAVCSAGEVESAPGSAAHVAAGSSAGAGSTAGSLPAAGPRSSSGGSASDGRTCHPCPRCGRECDAYCTCVAKHEWDSPCAPWPPRCPRQCSVWKSRQCDLPWGHEGSCCCGCSVPDDSTLGPNSVSACRRAAKREHQQGRPPLWRSARPRTRHLGHPRRTWPPSVSGGRRRPPPRRQA